MNEKFSDFKKAEMIAKKSKLKAEDFKLISKKIDFAVGKRVRVLLTELNFTK